MDEKLIKTAPLYSSQISLM